MPTLKYLDPVSGTYKPISGSPGPSPTPPPPSGVWGTPPLDVYGSDSLTGTEVYTDSAGKLRGRPQLLGGTKAVTDGVTTYPVGLSHYYIGGTDTTWPPGAAGLSGGALLVTQRHSNNAGMQWVYWYGTVTRAWMRHSSSSTAWSPWVQVVGDDTGWVNVGVVAGFAAQAGAAPQIRRIGKTVYHRGAWANTGIVANGSHGVGIIPAGFLPTAAFYQPAGTSSGAITGQFVPGASTGDSIQLRAGPTLSTAYYLVCSWLID